MEAEDEGRPKPHPAPNTAIIPSAHTLLNPKALGTIKTQKDDRTDISAVASRDDQSLTSGTSSYKSEPPQPNQFAQASIAARVSPPQFVFATGGNTYDEEDGEDYDAYNNTMGQAALLAKSQNIEDRSEQSAKRQKIAGVEGSTWVASKSTSEVSRHLKEKRVEGAARENSLAQSIIQETSPIDLTKDTEEELAENNDQTESMREEIASEGKKADEKEPDKIESEDPEVCIGQIDVRCFPNM